MRIANRRMLIGVLGAVLLIAPAIACASVNEPADLPLAVSPTAHETVDSPSLPGSAPLPSALHQSMDPSTPPPARQPTVRADNNPGAPPSPTATPAATTTPVLRRLTTGGCCTQPFWSSGSQRVLFIDKPASDAPVGIWGVDIAEPNTSPQLITERIAFYTAELEFAIELSDDTTIIERMADGERWAVPAGGRPVYPSPSRQRIAWEVNNDAPFERRITQVWTADLDGNDAQLVTEIKRGGFVGWASDDALLLSGHESFEAQEQVLYTLSLPDGQTLELARARRLRGAVLSPDGEWLAYFRTFDEDPAQNGLWLVRTDGTARRRLARGLFGAYQWRDSHHLLIVPFTPQATSHVLWEYDVSTDQARRLTNPEQTPFKIANGDWQVSPDGLHVAFVASRDHNIWLLTLPN